MDTNDPRLFIAAALIGLGALLLHRLLFRVAITPPSVSDNVSPKQIGSTTAKLFTNHGSRPAGEWIPVDFDYPHVDKCLNAVSDIKPIPYRPFKWGDYHVTMGIRSMPWDDWVELDNQFLQYHRIREERVKTKGDRLIQTLPATPGLVDSGRDAGKRDSSYPASPACSSRQIAKELVQELAEYLSQRFPDVYIIVRHDSDKDSSGWHGQSSIKEITIIPLRKTYKLDEEDPMTVSALLFVLPLNYKAKHDLMIAAVQYPGGPRDND
ncbi:hypothetical protein PHLCEN_2v2248 [Hermanssonia centrifuga]|uniref:Uncharacterized protein n=1 Tax=Hermanssonia centrifuga TaxID=98765 RepID=A0A2R6RPQ7_9APHY|nr:hypothetical protein PHLCEN_2v2248 [Hermanssonia centrifuga]